MATIQYNSNFDPSEYSWDYLVPFSSKQFSITGTNGLFPDPADTDTSDGTDDIPATIVCRGDFQYYLNNDGQLDGLSYGTVQSISIYIGAILDINIIGLSLSVNMFNSLMINFGATSIVQYLLNGNDIVNGSPRNDSLDGGLGRDTFYGGDGDDVFVVNDSSDIVVEYATANSGTDLVTSSVTYTLPVNVENLTLVGTANLNGTGNAAANILTGNLGNNILIGNDGDDTLDGGSGNDTLIGGNGNDVYIVNARGDSIQELNSEISGIDTVRSSVSWTLGANIEHMLLEGSSAIDGTGNDLENMITGNNGSNILSGAGGNDTMLGGAGNDTLYGGSGNDSLDGGSGSDFMVGGSGNDIYVVRDASDVVVETSSVISEVDSVFSYVGYTLDSNVENIKLLGSASNGYGNNLSNNISGNAISNKLYGGGGNDVLNGGSGNDFLYGGSGNDTLIGGKDSDMFCFTIAPGALNVDVISDFTHGIDKIVLDNDIYSALTVLGALSVAQFYKGASAHDGDDRIIFNTSTGALYYDADGNGIGASVQIATIAGTLRSAITNSDFLVVD